MVNITKIIIQLSSGQAAQMMATTAQAIGVRVTGVNPALGFVYADADANQVSQLASKQGVVKIFYDEPVGLI